MKVAQLARLALLTALVAAATLALRLPMPATEGYLNLGDALIIAGALLSGGRAGGLAGGLGSALADLYGGYTHWAPFTLVVKGLEGLLIGWLGNRPGIRQRWLLRAGIAALGMSWMVLGYFAVEFKFYGPGPAWGSLWGNALQGAASLTCGLPLAAALERRLQAPELRPPKTA
jgi:uncharacterized membrane protein